jgi:hypothetical protein
MIAALVLEFILLYCWHYVDAKAEKRFVYNACALVFLMQLAVTSVYLAWRYLP